MVENIGIAVGSVLVDHLLGKLLFMAAGERWKNSIRGMFLATTAIAVALYFLVSRW